jgi:hypothetical protein
MDCSIIKRLVILFGIFVVSDSCLQGQTLFEVNSLEFNTREFDEFAPVVYDDGLVFNTYRKQYLYKTEVDHEEGDINDLYFVQKQSNGKWGGLQFFSKDLNSRSHEGKATFTKDGNTIFFTRFGNPEGNIYKAIKSGGEWRNVMLISINSKEYRIKDPCLSADGKKMYFASMAPGGYGGYDIYVSSFERGDWATPKNLGPLVNTSGNEVAPFIHANGRLYFASNKLPGMGRYDIFYTREINGKWIAPQDLPAPINSNKDDMYYYSEAGDSSGYFSSNRNRSFDIFNFRSLWPDFGTCKPIEKNRYSYSFNEEGTVDNDTTTWLYQWDFGDGAKSTGKKPDAEHTYATPGQYQVLLNIIDTLTNEVVLNEDNYILNVTDIEQAYITSLDSLFTYEPAKFDGSLTYLPKFNKIDYYWDFGDGEKATGVITKHTYYSPGRYTVKLCVLSAPDDLGIIKKTCNSKEVIVKLNP